jgi:hypothetical protein
MAPQKSVAWWEADPSRGISASSLKQNSLHPLAFRFPPVRVEDYGPIGAWANQESQHPTKIQEGLLFGKPTMPVPGFNQP